MATVVRIVLYGVGGVGRALVSEVIGTRELHSLRYGVRLAFVALVDSSAALVPASGATELDDNVLRAALSHKETGAPLASFPPAAGADASAHVLSAPTAPSFALDVLPAGADAAGAGLTIAVDCSASTDTVAALLRTLESRGGRVVLCNKKPLTLSLDIFERLTARLSAARWESTVCAATPSIVTLSRMLAAGDKVTRVTGVFSGTMGYLMTGLQDGKLYSTVVAEAKASGYTEPDPRDDLGGVDVARKSLILARMLGWKLELADIPVEPLYPPSLADVSVPDFMAALPQLDADYASKIAAAKAKSQVMRYTATLEDGRVTVGPVFVDAASPLGRLSGTDNIIEIHSTYYSPNPLVIVGRGAGTFATASGVLADVVDLAIATL